MAAVKHGNELPTHPMKTDMDFCKAFSRDAAPRPIFDLSDVIPDNDLQTRLKAFFIDPQDAPGGSSSSPLYSSVGSGNEPVEEKKTVLKRDVYQMDGSRNLYEVLEYSLTDEWTKFSQRSM